MSKSQLRRLTITNPTLIAELREQIAREVEAAHKSKWINYPNIKGLCSHLCTYNDCTCLEVAALIRKHGDKLHD